MLKVLIHMGDPYLIDNPPDWQTALVLCFLLYVCQKEADGEVGCGEV